MLSWRRRRRSYVEIRRDRWDSETEGGLPYATPEQVVAATLRPGPIVPPPMTAEERRLDRWASETEGGLPYATPEQVAAAADWPRPIVPRPAASAERGHDGSR